VNIFFVIQFPHIYPNILFVSGFKDGGPKFRQVIQACTTMYRISIGR